MVKLREEEETCPDNVPDQRTGEDRPVSIPPHCWQYTTLSKVCEITLIRPCRCFNEREREQESKKEGQQARKGKNKA